MPLKIKYFYAILLLFAFPAFAQVNVTSYKQNIEWGALRTIDLGNLRLSVIAFDNAFFEKDSPVPHWQSSFGEMGENFSIRIDSCIFIPLSESESSFADQWLDLNNNELQTKFSEIVIQKNRKILVDILPYFKDSLSGKWSKLISFSVAVSSSSVKQKEILETSFASNSHLSQGNWYKLGVTKSGIYKITYQELTAMGIVVSNFNPSQFAVFGSYGLMLPEKNSTPRTDDIQELAIAVTGQDDGRFDPGDEIWFYAQGPVSWKYNTFYQLWEHTTHVYSDTISYFFTPDQGSGKRIAIPDNISTPPTKSVSEYDFYTFYNKDEFNLARSGRLWLGELFDVITTRTIPFQIPELANSGEIGFKIYTAASSANSSSFTITAGNQTWSIPHYPTSTSFNSPVASGTTSYKLFAGMQLPLNLNLKYNKPSSSAKAYLDYIDVSARCKLLFNSGQMIFSDPKSIGTGSIAQFTLQNAAGKATIWDVTDPLNCMKISHSTQGNDIQFIRPADELRQYVAFANDGFLTPVFKHKVVNQNLHALQHADMLIVAYDKFMPQALRLATYHATQSDLDVALFGLESVYNEFSAGTPDITAIRDFVRMMYEKSPAGKEPKYLLLFGDGSYDYKNILDANTNFIPTWQSIESFDPISSTTTDDYFGILDPNEGVSLADRIDIGIGRLPVRSLEEAEKVVDKIIFYSSADTSTMGDWQNVITFVADDDDEHTNDHVRDSEALAAVVSEQNENLNIDKIYLDSYVQLSVPNGTRYPEVNKAITQRIEKGSLIVNYIGHGGETGWSHEEVLSSNEINNWENMRNMPVFLTATCEFSRFDDPGRVSAGEWVLLNPKGGGVALFTTTRPTYGEQNFELNKSFFENAIPSLGEAPLRMGDIIKKAKQDHGSDDNGRKFVLLGDPAQFIAFPQLNVVTTLFNGQAISSNDTLKAFMDVTLQGEIQDAAGHLVSDFNGQLLPSVFDKPMSIKTLANDGGTVYSFTIQKNLLYRGKVKVNGGKFSFRFVVPKDIAYRFDKGKVSYFASDGLRTASGSYLPIIGGSLEVSNPDMQGPEIKLYMNDLRFNNGGLTDQNPWLIVKVSDNSGINTIGNGIGHDITAILDGVTSSPYILNDFYESDVDTYKSGTIHFPFSMLESGEHTLLVKVWDIFNNSSEAEIDFTVYSKNAFVIHKAYCYPNPFSENTRIVFEHNQKNVSFNQHVEIYNFTGQLVREIDQTDFQNGSISAPILWDGKDNRGNLMPPGMYVFRLTIFTSDGMFNEASGKMILTK